MKFGKRYSNITVLMAMLHGLLLGVLAIVIVGVFLIGAESKRPINEIEKEIPTSGSEEKDHEGGDDESLGGLTLYAKQHGAFTTSAAAATFMAEDPSLSTAAIMQVGGQYFVWSAVGQVEAEIEAILEADTYKKEFLAEPTACEVVQMEQLWTVLKINELEKMKKSILENEDEKLAQLAKQIDTITAFTDDLNVIRLHLLSNYVNVHNCVKISF